MRNQKELIFGVWDRSWDRVSIIMDIEIMYSCVRGFCGGVRMWIISDCIVESIKADETSKMVNKGAVLKGLQSE